MTLAAEDHGPRGDVASEAGLLPDIKEGRYEVHEYPYTWERTDSKRGGPMPCRIISGPSMWGYYKIAYPDPHAVGGEQIRHIKRVRTTR